MIYHFCLLRYSESIGSVWNAGIGNSDSIRSLLSIPAEFDVLSIVCIGYPDYSYLGSKPPRRDISTFSSLNLFKRPSHSLFPLRRNSDLSYELIKTIVIRMLFMILTFGLWLSSGSGGLMRYMLNLPSRCIYITTI